MSLTQTVGPEEAPKSPPRAPKVGETVSPILQEGALMDNILDVRHDGFVFECVEPYIQCHAASIYELESGDVLCSWYVKTEDRPGGIALLGARLAKGSYKWSQPSILVGLPQDRDQREFYNPLFLERAGLLRLLWVETDVALTHETMALFREGKHAFSVMYKESLDHGLTWTEPKALAVPPNTYLRNNIIQLSSGELVLPVYDEIERQSFMLISRDGGLTWEESSHIMTPSGNIQPATVELSDGRLMTYMRTRGFPVGQGGGSVWRAYSSDRGYSWSAPEPTEFPNPNSSIDMIRLANGDIILAYNHSEQERTPLNIAISRDEGNCWRWMSLEMGEGEFSYPSVVQDSNQDIHVVYTYRRKYEKHARIKHVVVEELE